MLKTLEFLRRQRAKGNRKQLNKGVGEKRQSGGINSKEEKSGISLLSLIEALTSHKNLLQTYIKGQTMNAITCHPHNITPSLCCAVIKRHSETILMTLL